MAFAALKTGTTGAVGTITYFDANNLTISSVPASGTLAAAVSGGTSSTTVGPVIGITTVAGSTNGAVLIRSGKSAAGTLTVNQAVSTVSTTLNATGGSVI